ncbi:hypothetical protein [Massilia niabensis]|uniref:Uncharacterized protein n=1 Tax=Massilia niabensis TaxID=544910 RepID=A0ABW0LBA8_9BURK
MANYELWVGRIAVVTDTKVSRVWRVWSKLGLNLPKRRPKKRRSGSDSRILGSTAHNSVWTDDFVHEQLANGGPIKLLCVLDENTRECLAIEVSSQAVHGRTDLSKGSTANCANA